MAKHEINAGATSQRFYIYLQDSTTGQGETGVTGATCYYLRDSVSGSMPAAVTLTFGAVFASPGTYPAWSSGQVREIGYMPGLYLIDIPDAVFAVGARNVVVQIFPTSGTPWLPVNLEFTLAAVNIYDAVRMGMTALPNIVQGNAGALITSGTGTAQLSVSSGLVTAGSISSGAITTSTFAAGAINAAAIADGAIDAATFTDSALVIGSAAGTGVKAYLGAGSITAGVVATGAIDADAIASAAITSAKFAGDAITASVIANGAIDAATFAAGAIDATAIATGAIDADAIAADAITSAKIANSAISIRLATDGTASEARIETGTVAADVWNALLASYAVNNSFGQRVLRSTTSQSTCAVTGSNHIAADIHELQPAVINNTHFAAGAIDANALAASAATEIATATLSADASVFTNPSAGYWIYEAGLNAQDAASNTAIIAGAAYQETMADALLGRNIAGGSNTGRLVKEALYALRNKSEIVGNTLNVYNNVDGVIAWSATVASSAGANPVTGVDPA